MWSLFAIAFLASEGSEMSEPQSLMFLPHSFFSPVSWQASCTEEAETKLLPVMTEGNTEKKEVRPLPVKECSHPSEILLLLAFVRATFPRTYRESSRLIIGNVMNA